ncbi:MAG: universal stress protein [Rhodobacteraceae bacterium]|nr:universal stress protein [Paracoccaceae bacterium]
MSFKSIITFVHDMKADDHVLQSAASIAAAHGAHLSVVCLGIDQTNPGVYYAGANALALQHTLEIAENEARSSEQAVRDALKGWDVQWDVSAITAQIGALGYVVGDRAQFADLVVLGKPYGPDRGVEDVAILEAALFRTRVPVVVLPEGVSENIEPKNILIAWNEGAEALAAVRAALPYLHVAENVCIAIIDPPSHGPTRSDPGGALASMLSRRQISTQVTLLPKTMPRVSDVLERHCGDFNTDLLVMGAYGHSRLREAILGGTTRNTLENATIPVLMAH